ncbi:MAG: alcohol dehydrogenase catalytic domain-containing protein [Pyrinomonadaceae bacterium]
MMRASVLCDVRRVELRSVPQPVLGPRDVLIRVSAVGLCGTDFHIYLGHANYNMDQRGRQIPLAVEPQIPGHEIAGVVQEIGREVCDLHVGDRVVVDQGINCFSANRETKCEYCATGDSHQCEFYREHGITGLPGGLAEYLAVPAVNAVRIKSDLEDAEAALTEPLGCIVHSSDLAEKTSARYSIRADDAQRRVRTILIIGAGPAGLLFTQYLRHVMHFDGQLIVSEPNARKREMASEFGADVLDPAQIDIVEAVSEMTGGRRVEYLIDSSGVGEIFHSIPGLMRKQVTLLLYGHGHAGTDLSVLNNVQFLEPAIVSPVGASGGFDQDERPRTYRRALQLLESGIIRVAPFITHRYRSLDAVPEAFEVGHQHEADYIKGVVLL